MQCFPIRSGRHIVLHIGERDARQLAENTFGGEAELDLSTLPRQPLSRQLLLGDVDSFVLHLFAAIPEQERALVFDAHQKAALQAGC